MPPNRKHHTVVCQLPENEWDILTDMASWYGRRGPSLSTLVRQAIHEYLERQGKLREPEVLAEGVTSEEQDELEHDALRGEH